MGRIGIMSAMIEEINHLLNIVELEKTIEIGQRKYYIGKIESKDVVIVFSRWGKVAASSTATTLINEFKVDELIFTGVAGSIDKNVHIGDIVIATSLVQHDFDASPFLEINTLPFINKKYLKSDETISENLTDSASLYLSKLNNKKFSDEFNISSPKIHSKIIASGDQFIKSNGRRDEIKEIDQNIVAVEMEGAAIAQVCIEYDIPFAVIRSISDSANEEAAISFEKFVNEVASEYSYNILKSYLSKFK